METEQMIAGLCRPEAYSHGPECVDLVQTHISWVFLAGDLVFKVKKPVDYGFLDFTSLEKRRHFCGEEVRLNRRLCPDLYLGVEPLTLDGEGRVRMGGPGEPLDYAVKMKRMPSDGMMLEKLDRGEVGQETMDVLAGLLADFYRLAETGGTVDEFGSREVIKFNTDENFAQTADYVDVALSEERFGRIRSFTDSFLEERGDLLERRIRGGYIRDCHGDLHMANICLGEKVWIFDCIEFNERFRFSDVASDLAFLAMDLDFRGRPELAERLVERYVELSGDKELPELLDFYKCYRAYVRGKINCFTFDQPAVPAIERERALDQARRYFALAYRYAGGVRRPGITAFFGLMGSGKSNWARETGRRRGALVITSDRVRKQMAGLSPLTRMYVPFGEGLYSAEASKKVYEIMHRAAGKLAGAGLDVILDASYMKAAEREALARTAREAGADLTFVYTEASDESILARLKKREDSGRSVSDGREEIFAAQKEKFAAPEAVAGSRLIRLSTDGPKEEVGPVLWRVLDKGQTARG